MTFLLFYFFIIYYFIIILFFCELLSLAHFALSEHAVYTKQTQLIAR